MKLLTEYALAALLIAGFIIFEYRTRHKRPFVLKQALFMSFIWACFCASLHLRRDLRVAGTMFLFILVSTSLAAFGRWAEQRHYQSTLPPKEPSEKVQS